MHQLIITFLVLASSTACVTTNSDKSSSSLASTRNSGVIVHQAGRKDALISKFNRRHWVSVRNATKPGHKNLYATLASGEWKVAESDARLYLRNTPKDEVALTVLSLSLGMQRRYNLANYYAKLTERYHGQSPESLNVRALATLFTMQGKPHDYRKAAELFYAGFQQRDNEIATGLNLGHLYLELGKSDAAGDIFDQVRERCRNCIEGLVGSGIANSRMRRYAEARKQFEQVLKKEEHHPQALYRLALIAKLGEGDYEKAKRYLDQLMVRTPDSEFMIRQKAEALVRLIDAEDNPEKATAIAGDRGLDSEDRKAMEAALEE